VDWEAFALMMDLAMMGCGTGAIIEPHLISRLPVVRNRLVIDAVSPIGVTPAPLRQEATTHTIEANRVAVRVGDPRLAQRQEARRRTATPQRRGWRTSGADEASCNHYSGTAVPGCGHGLSGWDMAHTISGP